MPGVIIRDVVDVMGFDGLCMGVGLGLNLAPALKANAAVGHGKPGAGIICLLGHDAIKADAAVGEFRQTRLPSLKSQALATMNGTYDVEAEDAKAFACRDYRNSAGRFTIEIA